jgi:hypothetical protein
VTKQLATYTAGSIVKAEALESTVIKNRTTTSGGAIEVRLSGYVDSMYGSFSKCKPFSAFNFLVYTTALHCIFFHVLPPTNLTLTFTFKSFSRRSYPERLTTDLWLWELYIHPNPHVIRIS